MKDSVTYFIDLKSKLSRTLPFPPSNDGLGMDGLSLEQGCKIEWDGEK
jgi:hypothetical protein